jgi:hypothetical protein
MPDPARRRDRLARAGLLGIGVLLLGLAWCTDPLGASPDSGLVDLGPTGTRWLLAGLGGCFLLGGAWPFRKPRGEASRGGGRSAPRG